MKVIWTELAKFQLKEVHQYYKEVAGKKIANSIKKKIFDKTSQFVKHPEIGQQELNLVVAPLGYRYLVCGNYKILYRFNKEEKISVNVAIFDARQHPDALQV